MHFAPYLANKIARWVVGNDMPSAPATVYCALFNDDPMDTGAVEVGGAIMGTAADRVAVDWAAVANDGTSNLATNDADVDFGASQSGGTVTIGGVALFDASSGGNMLFARAISPTKSVNEGDTVKITVGNLDVTIDKAA